MQIIHMKIIYKYQIQILNANIICSSHVQITYAKIIHKYSIQILEIKYYS